MNSLPCPPPSPLPVSATLPFNRGSQDLIETFTDVGRSWLKKIVRNVITSAATEAGLNLVIEPPSDKKILFVSVGVSEKEVKDRMMKLKVRAKAVVDALIAASKNPQLAPPKPLCSFLKRISSDGVYYPDARQVNGVTQPKFLWPEEEQVQIRFDCFCASSFFICTITLSTSVHCRSSTAAQALPLSTDERLIGIQPHQSFLLISNIMFARCLVMSIILEPWSNGIVPPSAQNKQSAANFKHIASLLLHAYTMALSSATGLPVALLRPVSAADGLLQASDEGFQVMLRYCGSEWLQQLKSSIEAWLVFIVQSASPQSAEPSQAQQQPASNQSAAEILAVPEVLVLLYVAPHV